MLGNSLMSGFKSGVFDYKEVRKVYHERPGGDPFASRELAPFVPIADWECNSCGLVTKNGMTTGVCNGKCCY